MPVTGDNNLPVPRKGTGFAGQKMIVLPQKVISRIKKSSVLNSLYLTHLGYFPKAKYHFRERGEGIEEYILVHCTDGHGWYEIGGERFTVEPNVMFMLPPGIPHRYSADSKDPWSIYWLHFAGIMAEKFTKSFTTGTEGVRRFIPYAEERVRIFNEMYHALERGYSTDNLGYANTCLWHFLGSLRFSNAYERLKSGEEEFGPVEDSISFMKENVHNSLSLEDLAENAHYSASYYSALFKRETGYSPIDYFIHLKIQRACQYLDLTALNVKEIARKLGYSDNHYFSRLFSKIMGLSPTDYRNKQKG